jgi:CO dehydrogenase nickel-insertion accessory protein CooC1
MKNAALWDLAPCGTNVSEESVASVLTAERIRELGTTLAKSSSLLVINNAHAASYPRRRHSSDIEILVTLLPLTDLQVHL